MDGQINRGKFMRSIDLTDVPPVSEEDFALAIRAMIETKRALVLVKGASKIDRAAIEVAFWDYFQGATATGVATLVRFWCLVEAFQARRVQLLLMFRGYALLGPAVKAAASLRLNLDWGFHPQRLIWAIGSARAAGMAMSHQAEETTDIWLAA